MEYKECVICLVNIHISLCSATIWGSYMKYDDQMHYVLFIAYDMGMILVTIYLYEYTHLYKRSVWFKFNLDDYLIPYKLMHLYGIHSLIYALLILVQIYHMELVKIFI